MTFINDYRQFIEVGCTSCGRKHTVQSGQYSVSSQGYSFHSPLSCPCGHTAGTAGKDKLFKTENNDMMKRNKATTIKLMLVFGFVLVLFAAEMVYMFNA